MNDWLPDPEARVPPSSIHAAQAMESGEKTASDRVHERLVGV